MGLRSLWGPDVYRLTGSGLEVADVCAPSALLPHAREAKTEASAAGDSRHLFGAVVDERGVEAALRMIPEEHRELVQAMDLEKLPIGTGWETEVTFAYNPFTRKARLLGYQLNRDYSGQDPDEIPCTLDVVSCLRFAQEQGYVEIWDYKGPHADVPPAVRNWQLRFGALCVCTCFSIFSAKVGTIRLMDDGRQVRNVAHLDELDLDLIHDQLMAMVRRIQGAEVVMTSGAVPDVVRGEHCAKCPAVISCPANGFLLLMMAMKPEEMAQSLKEVVVKDPAAAVANLKVAEKLLGEVSKAIDALAKQTPILMPNGKLYGTYLIRHDTIHPGTVRRVMQDLHGENAANIAAPIPAPLPEATKASINKAIRSVVAKDRKLKISHLEEAFYSALEKEDGIQHGKQPRLGLHWPKKAGEKDDEEDG